MNKFDVRVGIPAIMLALLGHVGVTTAAVTFIGEGAIPGNSIDQSGLTDLLEDGVTPHNQAGGFGSGFAHGAGNLYYAAPDRGPADGATRYIDRIYTLSIDLKRESVNRYQVKPEVVATRLMHNGAHRYFTGAATAFDATGSSASLRFDPEGVRVSSCGNSIYVSDEYGPYLYEFNIANGKRIRTLPLPNKYLADYHSAIPSVELSKNIAGRQPNRGMEGLAISPDGRKLYGIMQSPLLQDGALDATNNRIGLNSRIVEIDTITGAIREFVYPLDAKSNGISEILAVNEREFLVLERDGKPGTDAQVKKIYRIDLDGVTDIRDLKQLPTSGIPAGVVAAGKQLFIDLLDPAFGLAGASFPEKIEGLAFGPDLEDGRHLLLVVNDNDFIANQPTRLFAFAIDHHDLPGFQSQQVGRGYGGDCHHKD